MDTKRIRINSMSVIAVLFGLYFGVLIEPWYQSLLTDYYLPIGFAAILGALAVVPATLLFFWSVLIRKFIAKNDVLSPSHLFLLSFTSATGQGILVSLVNIDSYSVQMKFIISIILFVISFTLINVLHHLVFRKDTSITLAKTWATLIVLGVAVFVILELQTPSSAAAVCKKLHSGDSRENVLVAVQLYSERLSFEFSPDIPYTYGENTTTMLLYSPGIICSISLNEKGTIERIEFHSDGT